MNQRLWEFTAEWICASIGALAGIAVSIGILGIDGKYVMFVAFEAFILGFISRELFKIVWSQFKTVMEGE